MRNKRLLIVLLPFISLMIFPFVQAPTITACTLDKDTYNQGETGYLTVTIYNDEDREIRVTELSATIDYYYIEGNVYMQKFFTDTTLPVEIQQGQSRTFNIPFNLPANIAPGYTNLDVRTRTELWNIHLGRWLESDHPAYEPTLYIESPYKQQSQQQSIMTYLLGVTTIVFVAMTVFLTIINIRARFIKQPVA
ncbi:MAG: hypothetical protein JSV51_10150 [Candidatus Bathyarchaeota archaeon]|nr:MAG: hypothetical protein JSV51_10150 [Candidatus Bathyarchaeota archaeon]